MLLRLAVTRHTEIIEMQFLRQNVTLNLSYNINFLLKEIAKRLSLAIMSSKHFRLNKNFLMLPCCIVMSQVAVNGAHFASFPHRINMHSIKYFEVNGGVVVDQLETSYQVGI